MLLSVSRTRRRYRTEEESSPLLLAAEYRTGSPAHPPLCPYCDRPSRYYPSSEHLYRGTDYGPVYVCRQDRAWVGCHRYTDRPLGRLANSGLRRAKMNAHRALDRYWRVPGVSTAVRRERRRRCYAALARLLGIDADLCHIGYFDTDTCHRVERLVATGALERAYQEAWE